jgi:hypothetical protein
VTGGGAYKYAELIEKKLGLKIAKELQTVPTNIQ